MVRFLRIALTCLLALALPVQGYAASTMLSCGQAHHHAVLAAPVHDHAAMGAHHHSAPADEADGGGGHEQSTASGIAQDAGAADLQASKAAGGKCSVCAACCSV